MCIYFLSCNFTKLIEELYYNSFLIISLAFSMYWIITSTNSDNFNYFPIWTPFYFLLP